MTRLPQLPLLATRRGDGRRPGRSSRGLVASVMGLNDVDFEWSFAVNVTGRGWTRKRRLGVLDEGVLMRHVHFKESPISHFRI